MIIPLKYLEALKATVFALVMIWFTSLIFGINLKAFNTFQSLNTKFEYTDIYYSKIYEANSLSGNIALINIGKDKRKGIARLLNELSTVKTKVIGLDLSFIGKKDSLSDQLLSSAIVNCKNIVLINAYNPITGSNFPESPNLHIGSNQLITDSKGIVKYLELTKEGNFAQKLAAVAAGKAIEAKGISEINYHGNSDNFLRFESSEIPNPGIKTQLENKIIIIGYAGKNWGSKNEIEDRYFTPLDFSENRLNLPPTPGMVIHANAVQNIIGDSFVKVSAKWIDFCILFVLLLISNLFYIENFKGMSISFYLKSRLFQLVLVGLLTYLIFLIFDIFKIKFELAHWIIVIISSFELSMIYVYLFNHLGNKYGITSYIYNKLKS